MRRLLPILLAMSLAPFVLSSAPVRQVMPPAGSLIVPELRGATINNAFITAANTMGYTFTLGKKDDSLRVPLPNSLDFTGYDGIMLSVKNEGTTTAFFDFCLRGTVPGQPGESVLGLWHTLQPGEKKNLLFWRNTVPPPNRLEFPLPQNDEPFSRSLGYWGTLALTRIQSYRFWNLGTIPMKITIDDCRFVKARTDYTNLVDQFGQWNKYSFPNKLTSSSQLIERDNAEKNQLAALSGVNTMAGINGLPSTRATGAWRIERAPNGNQFIVTPQGKRFWMIGLNHIWGADAPIVEGRETMFQNLPAQSGPASEFYMRLPNKSDGFRWSYNFYNQNIASKFGANYRANWLDRTLRRLDKYGFNTSTSSTVDGILNTSVPNVARASTLNFPNRVVTPWTMHENPLDPFHPQFESWLTTHLTPIIAKINARPNVIGFHSDNEMSWGLRNNNIMQHSVALGILNSSNTLAAKVATMTMLRTRYRNNVGALNTAWNTTYANWGALEAVNGWGARPITPAASVDFKLILSNYADRYYSTVKRVLTALKFKGLYFGTRDAIDSTPREVFIAQSRYVDAISINLYSEDDALWAEINALPKPVIISEFCFSSADAGHYCPGIGFTVTNQIERSKRTLAYLRRAARSRNIIGACWWCYTDNPATGRWFDDERWNVGLVDITDTPYQGLVDTFRNVAGNIATLRPVR